MAHQAAAALLSSSAMLCAVSSSGDGARLRSPAREAVVVTGSFFPPGTVHVWSLDAQRGALLGLLAEAVKSVSPHRLDEVNRRGRRAGSWRRWRPDRRKLLTAVAVFAAGGRASLRAGELLPSLAPSLSLSLSLSLPQLAPLPGFAQAKLPPLTRAVAALRPSTSDANEMTMLVLTERGIFYSFRLDALRGGDGVLQDERRVGLVDS